MPELPEVETVRRGLEPVMHNARIRKVHLARPDLRFPFPDKFAERLEGQRLTHIGRRAKYLVCQTSGADALIMHLGMSGSFRVELGEGVSVPGVFYQPRSESKKHDHVVFDLDTEQGDASVIYNDPRRFGFMDLVDCGAIESSAHFRKMGIEPTGNQLNGATLSQLFAGKSAPLKAALLDQKLIAGLGNIYVCEALWRAGLSPKRMAKTIAAKNGKPTQRSEALAQHIREVIQEAIEAGGSSLRDHRQADGELGYFQHRFSAYDRKGSDCAKDNCDGIIARITQSGRSTFYCPTCQR